MRAMHSLRRTLSALALPIVVALSLALAACGDEPMLQLEDEVELDLFSEIEETRSGGGITQTASVILSPTFSESDLEKITRVRIVDRFDREWVLSEDPHFEAGDEGWILRAERSASQGFAAGPWQLRMVVEEEGVFVLRHQQPAAPINPPTILEAGVTPEGEVTVRWRTANELHDWTLEFVEVGPDGETVLHTASGQASGGARVTVGADVPPSSFEAPSELFYRFTLENRVSRRVVEAALTPEG